MARWKDVKKGRTVQKEVKTQNKPRVIYAGFWSRFLAFVTDVFMIGIPIVLIIMIFFGYETIKNQPGFMDGVEDAMAKKSVKEKVIQTNTTAETSLPSVEEVEKKAPDPLTFFITLALWAVIILGFWSRTGQTPGKKMAKIILVDSYTFKKPSFLQLIMRFVFLIMPLFAFISIPLMLLTKKKRTLHDLISRTTVIYKLD
jgi:uncharacterized RDD family membrane protein YckC